MSWNRTVLETLKPGVRSRSRLFLAALIWSLVGAGLALSGLRWMLGAGVAWWLPAIGVALLLGMVKGLGDVFETRSSAGGSDPIAQVRDNLPAADKTRIEGNLVWQALKRKGAAGWFLAGDDTLLEAMMSVTGSVIVGPLGEVLTGPLHDEEGVLVAEVDLDEVVRSRMDFDVTGHYARDDIFEFSARGQPETKKQ